MAGLLLFLVILTACGSTNSNFPTGKFIKAGTVDEGLIFNEDGTWIRFSNIFIYVNGTYNVDGNIYTETSNNGNGECDETNVRFKYKFDGKNLTFNYVGNPEDDACQERRSDFNNVTYTLADAGKANFPTGKFIKAGTTDYGLLFNADGTFSAFEGSNTFVHATYSVDGNIFTETSNDGGCKTNVSFTYTFDGTHLTFNYVGNPDDDAACDGRHADFNNVTYTLADAGESNFPTGKFIKAGTDYGLLFNTDGTFSVFSGSQTFVEGTYSVDGNVFTETSNNGGCETNVSFNYTFDGTNLTFNYVGNPDDDAACDGRHADFNGVTYTLSQ
jgi:hypothetical protein